jgi:hypothetical protein
VDHKLFFHFLDLTLLDNWIMLSSCGGKYIYQNTSTKISCSFWWGIWVKKLEETKSSHPKIGWNVKSAAATNVVYLESRHNQHWPAK